MWEGWVSHLKFLFREKFHLKTTAGFWQTVQGVTGKLTAWKGGIKRVQGPFKNLLRFHF
jgi:hypothetical protein